MRAARPKSAGEACEVVFFTGVRYEKVGLPEGRRAETASMRPGEMSATLTN